MRVKKVLTYGDGLRNIGNRKEVQMTIKKYRDRRKMTNHAFSQAVGLSPQYVSMITNGTQRASMQAAIQIHNNTKGQVTFQDLVGHELIK